MGYGFWPLGKMFIDWCPVPKRVWHVEADQTRIKIPFTRKRQWVLALSDHVPESVPYKVATVELRLLVYPLPDGRVGLRRYGWHGLSGTVIVGPEMLRGDVGR